MRVVRLLSFLYRVLGGKAILSSVIVVLTECGSVWMRMREGRKIFFELGAGILLLVKWQGRCHRRTWAIASGFICPFRNSRNFATDVFELEVDIIVLREGLKRIVVGNAFAISLLRAQSYIVFRRDLVG